MKRRSPLSTVALFLLGLLATNTSWARSPPDDEDEALHPTSWYGWQIFLADGASLGLALGGSAANQEGLFWIGYLSYVVAPPVIHVVHKNGGRAIADIALRLVVPPVTGLIFGAGSGDCGQGGEPSRCSHFRGGGILVGMGAIALIDAVAFAHETLPMGAMASRYAPSIVISERGTLLGLAGTF